MSIRYFIASIILLSSNLVMAQDEAAIHKFTISIDAELTEYYKESDKSKTWFSGWSVSDAMPENLVDSIKSKTETAFTGKFGLPAKMFFKRNKKGEIDSWAVTQIGVEGLPFCAFNTAKEGCASCKRFITIDVYIYSSGGSGIILGSEKKSKLKPKLSMTAKIFDENKTVVWEKKVVNSDFAKLRSVTRHYGNKEFTIADTLTPYDIYAMYLFSLDQLLTD